VTVVTLKADALDDLANKINVCASKADDYRVTAACHLAEAKRICGERDITFKEWVLENVKFSLNESYVLARCGEAPDPAKAIEDLRAKTKQSVERAREKVSLRSHTPQRTTIQIIETEDTDEEEAPEPGELPTSMRIRGFMHRAKEAAELARADDLAGISITEPMRSVAADAAQAWIDLLSKMESHNDS